MNKATSDKKIPVLKLRPQFPPDKVQVIRYMYKTHHLILEHLLNDFEKIPMLLECLEVGMKMDEALERAGIDAENFRKEYAANDRFRKLIIQAKTEMRIKAAKNLIKRIKKGDIEVSKWWLMNKYPDEFGNQAVQVNILQQFNTASENMDVKELAE